MDGGHQHHILIEVNNNWSTTFWLTTIYLEVNNGLFKCYKIASILDLLLFHVVGDLDKSEHEIGF